MIYESQKPLQLALANFEPKHQINAFEIVADLVEKEEKKIEKDDT